MANNLRARLCEDTGAQNVIGVHMRQDHICDRQVRLVPDGAVDFLAHLARAAAVNHRYGAVADDETDIGHITFVRRSRIAYGAAMQKNTGRRLSEFCCFRLPLAACRTCGTLREKQRGIGKILHKPLSTYRLRCPLVSGDQHRPTRLRIG